MLPWGRPARSSSLSSTNVKALVSLSTLSENLRVSKDMALLISRKRA
ncbi:MAG: hypothetical protein BWY72_01128 [Bacteroidetes bacterium ADurb.Bin416]|nr:MAG: hypothetical protein BWY72_01128 [Bacteroidetes bacterium ADurb.Bin416]